MLVGRLKLVLVHLDRFLGDVERCFVTFRHVLPRFRIFPHVSGCFVTFQDVSSHFGTFRHVSGCFFTFRDVEGF